MNKAIAIRFDSHGDFSIDAAEILERVSGGDVGVHGTLYYTEYDLGWFRFFIDHVCPTLSQPAPADAWVNAMCHSSYGSGNAINAACRQNVDGTNPVCLTNLAC